METIILASKSPRRIELLSLTGIPFEVFSPEVDETCDLPAEKAVVEISRRKASFSSAAYHGRFILSADTLVSVNGRKLGKPTDENDALDMLRMLSGRTHQVFTGVTVIAPDGTCRSGADRTDVTFSLIPEQEMKSYIRSGEPMDKAGSYAVQGMASLWVRHINGNYTSVIGLPLYLVRDLLISSGFPFFLNV